MKFWTPRDLWCNWKKLDTKTMLIYWIPVYSRTGYCTDWTDIWSKYGMCLCHSYFIVYVV